MRHACCAAIFLAASWALPGSLLGEEPAANPAGSLNFTNDILPVLSKYGCNSGSCHGKAIGQNGFKLSLYGFDPAFDYASIVHESHGRRVMVAAPAESLLLAKATGEIAHGGGVRFTANSAVYQRLQTWIGQAAPWGVDDAAEVVRLDVQPADTIVQASEATQLTATAHYSDGTQRDVTSLARYDSQTPELLEVSFGGEVQTAGRSGEGFVMIRYQNHVAIARFTQPFAAPLAETAYEHFEPKNWIDHLVLAKWKGLGIAPSGPSTDAEFLRRVYLDTLGALPTPEEVLAFVTDKDADKRDRLVGKVLDRPEFADLWAHQWGEVLRVKAKDKGNQERTTQFAAWIRKSIAENKPYDEFARDILAVRGKRADHPQMDWFRQAIDNQTRVEDASQVFLGLRVSCANCHNHPFENISQNDYWQFAAFFAKLGSKSYGAIDEITLNEKGTVENPRTGEKMTPRAYGSQSFEFEEGKDPRDQLMDWMTGPDNPYFARSVCNRIWGHYMHLGLVDPVDDMRATNPASNPQLLDELAGYLVENKYDLRQLMRAILTSRVYGLSSEPTEQNAVDTRNYARHYPRRLSPYVLMDAIASATGVANKFDDYPDIKKAVQLPNEMFRSDFLDIFGRSPRDTPCECETRLAPNLSQVLYLLHSEELQRKLIDAECVVAELVKASTPVNQAIEQLFLRTFSRQPTAAELAEAVNVVESCESVAVGLEDILWALMNSKEFLFNH